MGVGLPTLSIMTITPKQFNQLATKQDLKEFATKNHLDKKIGEVLNAVDGVAKKFDTIETEFKADKIAHVSTNYLSPL